MNPTPIFWLSAFALAAAVLAVLVWPLLRRRSSHLAPGDEAAATAIFRDHKRQLEDEFAAGTLTATERDAAQAELVARFGTELAAPPAADAAPSGRSRWIAAIVVAALVPVVAGVLYTMLGNPAAVNSVTVPVARNPHGDGSANDPQVVAMIEALAEKMKANPDDPNGWVLLGRSYLKMGRYDDSAAAFAEAAKRMPEVAVLLADQAEAIAMAQGKSLAGRPSELLKRALVLDPNDPKTVAMSGAAAAERKDYDSAIKLYTHLKSMVQPGSEDAQQIDQVLAELEAMKGGKPAPSVAAAPAATPAPAAAPAPAASAAATPATPAASSASAGSVSGRVEIDPKLAAKMAPGDKLYIYARNAEGSRMPLAITQGTAADLPKSFALTDAMAMTPAQTISMAKSVVIEARVSKGGTAMAQSGDLQGTSKALSPGATNVRIVIDHVVP